MIELLVVCYCKEELAREISRLKKVISEQCKEIELWSKAIGFAFSERSVKTKILERWKERYSKMNVISTCRYLLITKITGQKKVMGK